MLTLLSILFWIAIIAVAIGLFAHLVGRFLQVDRQPDAVIYATTEDGWRLGLARYRPQSPIHGAPPVLLCPGAALSAAIFDVLPETTLARYLAGCGYDVWLIDLRGRGLSERPRLWGRRRYTWTFDDYVEFDVPAVVEAVCRETGATAVQWIGLDLGALVLLAATDAPTTARVRSLAALGAPAVFRRQALLLPGWVLRLLRYVRLETVVRLAAPLLGRLYPPPLGLWQNRDNIDGHVYRKALVNAVCSFSRAEIQQYREWLGSDAFVAAEGVKDYRKALASVTLPVMMLHGPRDPLASPDMIEATVEALSGCEERVSLLASRVHGLSANYGHLDLVLGRNAARDIYPQLLRWLDLHAGVALPADRPRPLPSVAEESPSPQQAWEQATAPVRPVPPPPTEPPPAAPEDTPADADADAVDDIPWGDGDVPHVPRR
jgi:pimeloyl-ACP methyl ester carboxylesterase